MYIVNILVTDDNATFKHHQIFKCNTQEDAEIFVRYVKSINTNDIYYATISQESDIETLSHIDICNMKELSILNIAAKNAYLTKSHKNIKEISLQKQQFKNIIYIDTDEEVAV